jgi:SAM-dependent methyltransferase
MLDAHETEGPICHVGSLINNENPTDEQAASFRRNFAHLKNPEVVGIDLFPGKNVDVTADLCSESFSTDNPSIVGKFGLVLCWALLEHVQNPFVAAKNISALLRPGGHLYFSGPWSWGYHSYPDDYWRISFSGLKVLFPDVAFDQWWYTGTNIKVGIEITSPDLERKLFAQTSVTGVVTLISDRGMPYLQIGAIGRKK